MFFDNLSGRSNWSATSVATNLSKGLGKMANTLGELIGKVKHTFKTTNDNKEVATITVEFDFANCKDDAIKGMLVSNRAIIMQRPLRTLTPAEIKALDGTIVDAATCGKKVKTKREQFMIGIAALKAAGLKDKADELLAEWEANNQDDNEDNNE